MTSGSFSYQVVIDTHVPAPPVVQVAGSTTGGARNPTFTGQTEPFAVVAIDLVGLNGGGMVVGTAEADIHGDWSYPVAGAGLPSGVYVMAAAVMDVAGTWSLPAVTSFVVGSHAPGVPMTAAADQAALGIAALMGPLLNDPAHAGTGASPAFDESAAAPERQGRPGRPWRPAAQWGPSSTWSRP